MKTAIFERSTSAARPSVIVLYLGPGDIRELSINQAQHLYESIDMQLSHMVVIVTTGEGDTRTMSIPDAKHLHQSLEAALTDEREYRGG